MLADKEKVTCSYQADGKGGAIGSNGRTRAANSSAQSAQVLVIVDQTPECRVALRFAAPCAAHTSSIVTLLYVVPPANFQQWAGVERVMREEAYQAERAIQEQPRPWVRSSVQCPELVTLRAVRSMRCVRC